MARGDISGCRAYVCEHGVTPELVIELAFTTTLDDEQTAVFLHGLYGPDAPDSRR